VLGDIRLRHSVKPSEPVSAARGQADENRGLRHPPGEQRRARQRVGSATGPPDYGEPFQAEGVRDGQHIVGRVRDPPTRHAV
jgi:hypothetical protein